MQASLESETTRQKRQQEYGYNPRTGARAVSGSEGSADGLKDGERGECWKGNRNVSQEAVETEDDTKESVQASTGQRMPQRQRTYARRGSQRYRKMMMKRDDKIGLAHLETSNASSALMEGGSEERSCAKYNLRKRTSLPIASRLSLEVAKLAAVKPKKKKNRNGPKKAETPMWWKSANAVRINLYLSFLTHA
jgi:hypothetical protein